MVQSIYLRPGNSYKEHERELSLENGNERFYWRINESGWHIGLVGDQSTYKNAMLPIRIRNEA